MNKVSEPLVLTEVRGALGVVTLNRPRAVNALSYEMLQLVDNALSDFEGNPDIHAVLIRGAGERGLCAGGDIVALYRWAQAGDFVSIRKYFSLEYNLNLRISQYPKPYIAFMDGLTLGGGVGVSTHGSHRIVTENSRVGMPETVIGFSPDIGALNILARAPHHLGTLMALTGVHVSGADAIAVGLADTFVPAARLERLQEALTKITDAAQVDGVLASYVADPDPSALLENADAIERIFSAQCVEEIYAVLRKEVRADAPDLLKEALAAFEKNSPTGIKTAFEALKRARSQSLAETLNQDFVTSNKAASRHELIEGIRAQVVDKDRSPRWQPATFEEVSEELVASFFAPLS